MTDWAKHGFGPGTNVCCRCLETKETTRFRSKWCAKCDRQMRPLRSEGALDPDTRKRPNRGVRIINKGKAS